ncbi:DUF1707 domain-containing protein [uncultured Corynebacterium sp.]|uniref:DUF1707 SHOCT-like domain-containing protein n=1 Tax=uncultured Corynebacterium sp. TaxID=159447 RepID=UPI0025F659CC|nr:DUF1707 domain-containing protein [uncultured Corynebacterium sp.]
MTENFDPNQVRVGDPERSEALDRLGEHFANGYLDVNEFEERTGRAAAARTRADLTALFGDLPGGQAQQAPVPATVENGSTVANAEYSDRELDEALDRKKKLNRALGILWSITMAAFFLWLFVFEGDYFWVVFPVAGMLTWGLYSYYDIGDEEDEMLDKILEDRGKERAERLRIAHQRRKELGK